ncbi:hypothetical protein GC096_14945 [Paenibacillus sp. LMG 31461]|uniref:DUF6597 domain-containing protein n=1 Tax=Paenibacillus plantarum TaxID=2654975 RepID=A0ABX1XBG2_9BACL|nr:DUF6597 domain-containing transcriptional factor [Paenibacillus plantarum]NOU65329.1 hypothetical protein [Paenibacillus plantarum]
MPIYCPIQPPVFLKETPNPNYVYREYAPSKALVPYIACYWKLDFRTDDGKDLLHRIIPDGCADIIIDMNPASTSQGAFVTGLMTSFETMNLSSDCSLFGIRFYPHKMRYFIKYPVSELTGYQVLLEDVWGNEADLVANELRSAQTLLDAIVRLEVRLQNVLLRNEYEFESPLRVALCVMGTTINLTLFTPLNDYTEWCQIRFGLEVVRFLQAEMLLLER